MEDMFIKNLLMDFYGPLLTKRQRYCMQQHYEHDLSLGEIAEDLEISRQAVHDNLQRASQSLQAYEDKLHLVAAYTKRQEVIAKLEERLATLGIEDKEIVSLLDEL